MLHFETETERSTDSFSGFSAPPEKILFIDIETTGFSADSAYVYLIGTAFLADGRVHIQQWLLDDFACEKELLSVFLKFCADFSLLVHYNGTAFDIPFLQKRCRRYRLPDRLSGLAQTDLYRSLSPYRRILGLADLKQKTVEQRIGLQREDRFSGGDLIPVYAEFLGRFRFERLRAREGEADTGADTASAAADALSGGNFPASSRDIPDFSDTGLVRMPESPAKALLYVLLLHNREDLTGLLSIAPLNHALKALADASGWKYLIPANPSLTEAAEPETAAVFRLQCSAVVGVSQLLFPEPVSRLLPAGDLAAAAETTAVPEVSCCAESAVPLKPLTAAAPSPPAKAALPALTLSAEPEGFFTLKIPYFYGILKYFYEDYKDYYYLPLEDCAIHKSVAEFVDKAYRKKATRKTCYQKKEGKFLPQTEAVCSPEFRPEPKTPISFFEPDSSFFQDRQRLERWLSGLLCWLLGRS